MSLSYQDAPHNAVFELSTQVGIVRNKLCDLKKELDSSKTADALALKTATDNLQAEIDSIDSQLKALKDEPSYTHSREETKIDLNVTKTREVLQSYNDKTKHKGVAIKTKSNALGSDQQNLFAKGKTEYNVDIGFQLINIKSTTTVAGDITLKAENSINIHHGYNGTLSMGGGLSLSFASNGIQNLLFFDVIVFFDVFDFINDFFLF
jgi:hypothetical protein